MLMRNLSLMALISIFFPISIVQAQTAVDLQSFIQQSDSLSVGIDGVGSDAGIDSSILPAADTADIVNAESVREDISIVVQTQASAQSKQSVVQDYYRFLTGEELNVYGALEFSQAQDNKILFFNTLGKEYRLAPGDIVHITVRGLRQIDKSIQVTQDGKLILSDLQPISVTGLSLTQLESLLYETLKYDDASVSVYVALETARLVTVQVSGAVNNPRTIAVPAYTPLSRVLAYSGGIRPTGSLRGVVLRENDTNVATVDFYEFLQSPEGANDPLVTNSARIFVPNQNGTVAAVGFVGAPGIYELMDGQASIFVKDLLELSGTKIIPPGLALEALYFDENGVSQARKIDLQSTIAVGEVLRLRFVQTRLQQSIKVLGAVLDEYEMPTSESVQISEILRAGATLAANARVDFALLLSQDTSVQAIDLTKALVANNLSLSPGDTLFVPNFDQYKKLVRANPNLSDDPFVSALQRAGIVEIYLNNTRIAVAAPNAEETFSTFIERYYSPTPETYLELAIIERSRGFPVSESLRSLFTSSDIFAAEAGTKIHFFEASYITDFVERLQLGNSLEAVSFSQDAKDAALSRLLLESGTTRVAVDGKIFGIIPSGEVSSLRAVFDIIGIERSLGNFSDFVQVEIAANSSVPIMSSLSLTQNFSEPLPQLNSLTFWSIEKFQEEIVQANGPMLSKYFEIGIPIFVDYALFDVLSQSALKSGSDVLGNKILGGDIYPLFAVHAQYNDVTLSWDYREISLQDVVSIGSNKRIVAGDRVYVFTNSFIENISSKLSNASATAVQSQNLNTEDINLSDPIILDGNKRLTSADISSALSEVVGNVANVTYQRFDPELFSSNSIFVNGAVARPGYYPIAGPVAVSQLLNVAGGLRGDADVERVEIQYYEVRNGSYVYGPKVTVNGSLPSSLDRQLVGRFSVNVNQLIDNVATGVVTLSGEVMRPGSYLIARDETLHDIIARAGGLSPVAYPLGAVFTRRSLIEVEKANNEILANQLEQAVLGLSVSEQSGAKDQIDTLLRYAQALKSQDAIGRMTVNVSSEIPEAPVYLQDGDVLEIPKRPSHVAVIGAVNKDTIAAYVPGGSLGGYLAAAGGATRSADMKNAYLYLPNGQSNPLDGDTIIPPGAAIVLPPKTDRLTVLGITDLATRVLGNIATSVLAINNVK